MEQIIQEFQHRFDAEAERLRENTWEEANAAQAERDNLRDEAARAEIDRIREQMRVEVEMALAEKKEAEEMARNYHNAFTVVEDEAKASAREIETMWTEIDRVRAQSRLDAETARLDAETARAMKEETELMLQQILAAQDPEEVNDQCDYVLIRSRTPNRKHANVRGVGRKRGMPCGYPVVEGSREKRCRFHRARNLRAAQRNIALSRARVSGRSRRELNLAA